MYSQNLMTTTVTTVTPDTLVRRAYQVMRATHMRHLPVVGGRGHPRRDHHGPRYPPGRGL